MNETINDQYVIIEKIGEGGMGSVYLAEDVLLQRKVAIKSLNKPKATPTDELEGRFQQEALALARLNHPNITHVYTFVQHQQNFWMVMEYVEGKTLEDWIKHHGAISASLACSITVQILNGLEHAHHKGIIHRDLKPANIMISSEGEIKIMDFGIARIRNSQRLTQHGKSVGTLEYMAPEQIQGKEGDELTDIYATGNMLYEMLSGITPFKNDTDYHLMKAKLEEKVVLHPDLLNRAKPALQQVILKALERNPSKRYEHVQSFRNALIQHAGINILTGNILHDALLQNQPDIWESGSARSRKFSFQKPVKALSSLPGSVAWLVENTAPGEKIAVLKKWWNGGNVDKSIKLLVAVVVICLGLVTWNYFHNNSIAEQADLPKLKVDYTVKLSTDSLTQPAVNTGIIEQQLMENQGVYSESVASPSNETKEEATVPVESKTKKSQEKSSPRENKKKIEETKAGKGGDQPAENKGSIEEKVKEPVQSNRSAVTVPRGIDISLILQESLSSEEKNKDGSLITLTSAEDVKINGQVIIERGAGAVGKIVDVVPSSKRKPGLIGFVIIKVTARDGSDIRLSSDRFRLKAGNDNEPAIFVSGKVFTATVHKSVIVK